MNDQIAALIDRWSDVLVSGAIVFLRVGSFMALVPGFGERSVPVRVKLGLAIAFTCVVAPAVAESLPDAPVNLVTGAFLLLQETMIGLSLGLVVRCGLLAVEMAGSWAAQSSSLSQMFGVAGEPMPAMSHLFVAAALALAMIGGLHVKLAAALILSYDALPAGQMPQAILIEKWGVSQIAGAFNLAFSLSAPFVIAALIYNVALGFINRAMPALMVSFVCAPALTAGALVLLAITAPLMLAIWWHTFADLLADPFKMSP